MNLRKCVTCTPLPIANKAAHSGFEAQRRHHQKSKTGVLVAPQKGLMSSKFFFKSLYMRIGSWSASIWFCSPSVFVAVAFLSLTQSHWIGMEIISSIFDAIAYAPFGWTLKLSPWTELKGLFTLIERKSELFFGFCRCSIWTYIWIFYDPIWKRRRFRFRTGQYKQP